MIFTIGDKINYPRMLAEFTKNGEKLYKKGRDGEYPGGSVFETKESAEKYCLEHPKYAVFGLLADWQKDTEKTGELYHLLIDAEIIAIINGGMEDCKTYT